MDLKQRRRRFRRDIGSYGWALVIYYLLMTVCVVVVSYMDVTMRTVQAMLENPMAEVVVDEAQLMGNGWGYIIACILAVLFIRLWKGKTFFRGMWISRREMKPGAFFGLLSLFVGGQLVFQLVAVIEEMILNLFGLSVIEAMELATGFTDTFSMFLYSCLFAPIVEELVFRGVVMRGLEKYGRWFAIVVSAILFGLFHGNPAQSPYAFAAGLVMGYVAMEYNLVWAMLMHMINNLALGDLIPRMTQWLGAIGSGMVVQAIIWISAVAGIICLVRKREDLGIYRLIHPTAMGSWRGFLTAPGVIVLAILMTVNGISMLI